MYSLYVFVLIVCSDVDTSGWLSPYHVQGHSESYKISDGRLEFTRVGFNSNQLKLNSLWLGFENQMKPTWSAVCRVENSGSQEYSKALNADYQLPNRKQLALMVDGKYKLVYESLKKELGDVSYLALTSDVWTSDSNKSFISLTVHYIYQYTRKLKSVVISTSEIQIHHTAENIALAIQEVIRPVANKLKSSNYCYN